MTVSNTPESYLDERCPLAYDGGTHHFMPKRDGVARGSRGEPAYVQCCMYCGVTQHYDTSNNRVVLQHPQPGRSRTTRRV